MRAAGPRLISRPEFPNARAEQRRLVIEVDGGQHAESMRDRERDAFLDSLGYRIIRVWNNEVLGNIEGILEMLVRELQAAPHPVPLPASGERERC